MGPLQVLHHLLSCVALLVALPVVVSVAGVVMGVLVVLEHLKLLFVVALTKLTSTLGGRVAPPRLLPSPRRPRHLPRQLPRHLPPPTRMGSRLSPSLHSSRIPSLSTVHTYTPIHRHHTNTHTTTTLTTTTPQQPPPHYNTATTPPPTQLPPLSPQHLSPLLPLLAAIDCWVPLPTPPPHRRGCLPGPKPMRQKRTAPDGDNAFPAAKRHCLPRPAPPQLPAPPLLVVQRSSSALAGRVEVLPPAAKRHCATAPPPPSATVLLLPPQEESSYMAVEVPLPPLAANPTSPSADIEMDDCGWLDNVDMGNVEMGNVEMGDVWPDSATQDVDMGDVDGVAAGSLADFGAVAAVVAAEVNPFATQQRRRRRRH
eukprot:GHVS01052510.1.p1 GENE.GHVS01052510.1~~GHVS01052510.1.p1  ORF type:complete len:369 (-),score=109.27 GHVS01052510.1:813-1919(-)